MDTLVAPQAAVVTYSIALHTDEPSQFVDITERVAECVREAGLTQGLAVVSSRHTTAAIVVNEHEPELIRDLQRLLEDIAPQDAHYSHNGAPCGAFEEPNGHAHCRALLLGASASLPVVNGSLMTGRWQRIFLVELDRARPRTVTVTLLGV